MALNILRQEFLLTIWSASRREVSRVCACNAALRQFHATSSNDSEDKKSPIRRKKKFQEMKANSRPVTEEMRRAATEVAKNLGGNWTKTAEELLTRLASHQEPPAATESADGPVTKPVASGSLLNTMGVGKFVKERGQAREKEHSSIAREQVDLKDLFGAERLGIFDPAQVQAAYADCERAEANNNDLWHTVERENVIKEQGSIPRNAFDEMARLTREGKMWKFPVDNEADLHEEKQYKFYDHIFLDKHLGEFPDQGPIRKFMELVVVGLGSNPWLSVPEKIGHIRWYADYFREKEDILVASIGEQGKMKEKSPPEN